MTLSNTIPAPRIVVALDFPDAQSALALAERLDPSACRVKIGKELFTAAGPQLVEKLVRRRFPVFLDLKFHDIPNTAAAACRAAAALGVWMVNVHALGGRRMMEAAREAVGGATKLVAVTVLTSMEAADLREVGISESPRDAVLRLARLAHAAGLDGVVCSGQEAHVLRETLGPQFCLVTPGIRPAGADDDQRRVLTPRAAIGEGAHYLVVGRPITRAADPLAALYAMNADIAGVAS